MASHASTAEPKNMMGEAAKGDAPTKSGPGIRNNANPPSFKKSKAKNEPAVMNNL